METQTTYAEELREEADRAALEERILSAARPALSEVLKIVFERLPAAGVDRKTCLEIESAVSNLQFRTMDAVFAALAE